MPDASAVARAIFDGGPAPAPPRRLAFGTAGFRAKAGELDVVMFRVGALAALRAAQTGKVVGVMVTASHNQGADNGSKIVDPDGGMLAADWESIATALANAGDLAAVEAALALLALPPAGAPAHVVLGRDTRLSSPHLAGLVARGVAAAGGSVHELGIVTTPQVHWAVRGANLATPATVPPLSDYYEEHIAALRTLLSAGDVAPITIYVDCANGVGAKSVADMRAALQSSGLPITLVGFNTEDVDFLNSGCGAEFVQKSKELPRNFDAVAAEAAATAGCVLWASFDGDADRVVMFYAEGSDLVLLDGDKMACLLARSIAQMLVAVDLRLSLGVVQTAYANGASTVFLKQTLASMGCSWDIATVATGVKHLHHKAQEYDIGVYFEANGHGTVLFSPTARAAISASASRERQAGAGIGAAQKLEALSLLINPAIGDALSDLLAVVAVLVVEHISVQQMAAMYKDLPSLMTKVMVRDRTLLKTSADETQVLDPKELQSKIDALAAGVDKGRSFVRPSGTEDCVRVYAEGSTQAAADGLAQDVGKQVALLLG